MIVKYRSYLVRNSLIGRSTNFYDIDIKSLVRKILEMSNKIYIDITIDENRILRIHTREDTHVDSWIYNESVIGGTPKQIQLDSLEEQIIHYLTCHYSSL